MNFTAAELRTLAFLCDDQPNCPMEIGNALREYADLKEAAEKGVTDEVVRGAYAVYTYNYSGKEGMRATLLAVAPLLALKGDKP